jgi:hypothetical protein
VNGKDDSAEIRSLMIDASLAGDVVKTPLLNGFVKGLVPNSAGLLHAVDTSHELHYPVLFAENFEAGRLFHKHGFRL